MIKAGPDKSAMCSWINSAAGFSHRYSNKKRRKQTNTKKEKLTCRHFYFGFFRVLALKKQAILE